MRKCRPEGEGRRRRKRGKERARAQERGVKTRTSTGSGSARRSEERCGQRFREARPERVTRDGKKRKTFTSGSLAMSKENRK